MKLLLKILTQPLVLFWLLLLFAWILRQWGKKSWAHRFSIAAFLWLFLISTPFLPRALIRYLENQYPHLSMAELAFSKEDSLHIMVLAAGYTPDPRLAYSGQLNTVSLARLAEGIRIAERFPNSKIICSAKGFPGAAESQAEVFARAAQELGFSPDRLELIPTAKTTSDEAEGYQQTFGASFPLILVTSANHMPRAIQHFKKAGVTPIPAPTDFMVKKNPFEIPWNVFPGSANIRLMETATHEYLGLLWMNLAGN